MYRCDLETPDGFQISTRFIGADEIKAATPLHGRVDFEVRTMPKGKTGRRYLSVEKGAPRHSLWWQLPVTLLAIGLFAGTHFGLLGLLRLAAKAVRP